MRVFVVSLLFAFGSAMYIAPEAQNKEPQANIGNQDNGDQYQTLSAHREPPQQFICGTPPHSNDYPVPDYVQQQPPQQFICGTPPQSNDYPVPSYIQILIPYPCYPSQCGRPQVIAEPIYTDNVHPNWLPYDGHHHEQVHTIPYDNHHDVEPTFQIAGQPKADDNQHTPICEKAPEVGKAEDQNTPERSA